MRIKEKKAEQAAYNERRKQQTMKQQPNRTEEVRQAGTQQQPDTSVTKKTTHNSPVMVASGVLAPPRRPRLTVMFA